MRYCLIVAMTVSLGISTLAAGQTTESPTTQLDVPEPRPLMQRDTMTDDWFGLGKHMRDRGLDLLLGVTQIYQQNLHGGKSTNNHSDRYTGSYNLEIRGDLEQMARLRGGSFYAELEGSWNKGINNEEVGSLFGVNDDAAGNSPAYLTQLYYQQKIIGDRLQMRVGKLDLTGGFECRGCPVSFDGNSFANDQTAQFLNSALVNNPTIPFPDPGLAVVVHAEPIEWWYVTAAVADANAYDHETGLNTTFHGPDEFFAIAETGVTPRLRGPRGPLQGAYRVGLWYDPQPKAYLDRPGSRRDDVGFYLSFDQVVFKENDRADDRQGLGLFARYGYAHGDVNEIRCFWSVGGQYRGLIPGRDADLFGLGVAQGRLSPHATMADPRDPDDLVSLPYSHETVIESYYNIFLTPWLAISPNVQYIFNPGGIYDDAVVVGARMQLTF